MLETLNELNDVSTKVDVAAGLPSVVYASCNPSPTSSAVVCVDNAVFDDATKDLVTFLVDFFNSDRFLTVNDF